MSGEPDTTSAGDDPLLDIAGFNLDFGTAKGRIHALRNVDLRVPAGEVVGLVGESGSGKSTLAYSVIGLLPENAEITGGTIRFQECDLLQLSTRARRALRGRQMSMIFQDPMTSLNPVLSIERQMVDIQHRESISRREKRNRAIEMLARVGIPDPKARIKGYAHEFSGGMRQRISIAMALLIKPALLIADEPTTALDATLEVQILRLLRELQEEVGCSILFVTHHLGTVVELCDRVAVMYAGEVVEYGTVLDVFRHPAHPYTQALLECDPGRIHEKTRQLPTIPGEVPNLSDVPPGCVFRGRCRQAFERCTSEHPNDHRISASQTAKCHLLDTTPGDAR